MSFSSASSVQKRHQPRQRPFLLSSRHTHCPPQAQVLSLISPKLGVMLVALSVACLWAVLAGLGLAFASASVHADDVNYNVGTKAADQWLMAKYDSNGDSVISAEEISQKRERMFSAMDDNGDGIVNLDEYELLDIKKRALIVKARFNKLDINGDGQLTDGEYVSYYGSFGAFDLDGDGQITAAEMKLDGSKIPSSVQAAANPKCFLWLCVRANVN